MIPTLLVDIAATHRITRLITRDRVAAPLREAWICEQYERIGRFPDLVGESWSETMAADPHPPEWARFVECPWCVSMWVAAAAAAARALVPRWWDPLARVLAASSVASLAITLE